MPSSQRCKTRTPSSSSSCSSSVRRAGLDVSTNKKILELYEEVEYLIKVCLDIPESEPLAGPGKASQMGMAPKKKKKYGLTFNPFGKKK